MLGDFLSERLDDSKPVVVSFDLDYTLVNREKGGNYVAAENLFFLEKLSQINDVFLLANTGREWYGFKSFMDEINFFDSGIFGSGRGIYLKSIGKEIYSDVASIEIEVVEAVVDLVKRGVVPFVDVSYFNDRVVVFNYELWREYSDLFLCQNPMDWFSDGFPKFQNVENVNDLDLVYRVEIPVFQSEDPEFFKVLKNGGGALEYLFSRLLMQEKVSKYNLKKKKHYYDGGWKGNFLFARLEKNSEELGKGSGILKWADSLGIDIEDFNVIHIGDQDHGLINDTEVKQVLVDSLLFMVGERCNPKNPLIDMYLGVDTDKGVNRLLGDLLKWKK